MVQRLTLLAIASIAICIALRFSVWFFLADVAPTTWGDEPAPFWRLETAVLLTTLQWITGVVGAISTAGVIVLRYYERLAP
jgi:hypothetical protein